jgi:hypothetical protein
MSMNYVPEHKNILLSFYVGGNEIMHNCLQLFFLTLVQYDCKNLLYSILYTIRSMQAILFLVGSAQSHEDAGLEPHGAGGGGHTQRDSQVYITVLCDSATET